VHTKDAVDKAISGISDQLQTLNKDFRSREKQIDEIKEWRIVRKDLDALSSRTLSKSELKKLFDKLNEDLLFLDNRLSEMEKESVMMDDIEAGFMPRKEADKAIADARKECVRMTEQLSKRLTELDETLSRHAYEKATVNDIAGIRDEIEAVRENLPKKGSIQSMNQKMGDIQKNLAAVEERTRASADTKFKQLTDKFGSMSQNLSKTAKSDEVMQQRLDALMKQVAALSTMTASMNELSSKVRALEKENKAKTGAIRKLEKEIRRKR
jgi:prefoldin subunit 5